MKLRARFIPLSGTVVGRASRPPKVNLTSEYPVEARSSLIDILETIVDSKENCVHYAANRISPR